MTCRKQRYVVHLFVISRLAAAPIETTSARLAALKARDWYCRNRDDLDAGEFTLNDEISHYLVDVEGDGEHSQGESFEAKENPLLSVMRDIVDWFERKTDAKEITDIVNDARESLRNTV
jgi:hypothetical protein